MSVVMIDKRLQRRFACERNVQVAFFQQGRHCGMQDGMVCDVSEGGVRISLKEQPPACDRLVVRSGGLVIRYRPRSKSERDGLYYVGAEVM